MAIPMAYLKTLSEAIDNISGAGQNAVMAILNRLVKNGGYETPEDLVEDALAELEPLFQAVAERCASLSATSYDILRTSAVGEGIGATPYPDRDIEWTRRALHAIAAQSKDIESFGRSVAARLDYEAKRASGSTMFSNGVDDPMHPRYARVPTGPETCPFCIMLASRGFDYYSERSAGKLDHYHAHCDCRVVPQFGSESYEGYDPDDYLRQYAEMMDNGTLNAEALSRSATRAKQRRREEAAIDEARNLKEIRSNLAAGKVLTFDAKGPDGGEVKFTMHPVAIGNMRGDIDGLGFDRGTNAELAREIMRRSSGHSFKDSSHGRDLFDQNVRMRGPNGKMGRVKLTWKVSDGTAVLVDAELLKMGARR